MTKAAKRLTPPGVYAQYWHLYGGWGALVTSRYFYCSLVLTGLSYWYWCEESWWDVTISILPSVLGFSIAAFTMLLAFGHDRFLVVLSQRPSPGEASALEVTVAAFFHFLIVQVLALVTALLRKALVPLGVRLIRMGSRIWLSHSTLKMVMHDTGLAISAFGFFLLCYSLFCALAASARLFNLALRFREVIEQDEIRRLDQEEAELDAEYARSITAPEEPHSQDQSKF